MSGFGEAVVAGIITSIALAVVWVVLEIVVLGFLTLIGKFEPEYEVNKGYEGNSYRTYENPHHALAAIGHGLWAIGLMMAACVGLLWLLGKVALALGIVAV